MTATQSPTPSGPISRAVRLSTHIAPPALFFVLILTLHPFGEVFFYDFDEGNNTMKALLLTRGYGLYTRIWSDQPPLFTYMLHWWLDLTNWTMYSARILVLLCSSVLLWAMYQTVRLGWGHVAAASSVLLVVVSGGYVRLSVSVMLAIPSLMFAMLSVYALARWQRRPHWLWMVLSGVLLALSILTKMWTAVLVPALLVAVVWMSWIGRDGGHGWRAGLKSVAQWGGGLLVCAAVLVMVMVPLDEMRQLIAPHLDARGDNWFGITADTVTSLLKKDLAIALLGVIGLLYAVSRRQWFSLLPGIWCAGGWLVLHRHLPLWYHHYLLVSIPMCWLAGIALAGVLPARVTKSLRPWQGLSSAWALAPNVGTLVLIVFVTTTLPSFLERNFRKSGLRQQTHYRYVAAVMEQLKDQTRYVVTDLQVLPFHVGLIVPPELSVTSLKRLRTGYLTIEQLIGILDRDQPEQIVLSGTRRIPLTAQLIAYLKEHYTPVYGDNRSVRHLVTKRWADRVLPALRRALAAVPNCWQAYVNIAEKLTLAGRREEAARAYRQALEYLPNTAEYAALAQQLRYFHQDVVAKPKKPDSPIDQ